MSTNIPKYKRLFFFIFWSLLTLTVLPYVYIDKNLFYWVIYIITVMSCFIIVAHYLSDIALPKALKEDKMKRFLLMFFIGILLLDALIALCFTLFPYSINDTRVLIVANVSTWKELYFSKAFSSLPSAMAIITTTCGIRFYEEHNKVEQINAKLRQEHLEAQIKILQDQINPHLMFNVLNHIHILMQSNVELASTVLLNFSDILRYQLYECNQKQVFLHQEIQYLQQLVAIEQIRWQDELDVECTWETENNQLQIAPLLLVPLIENAFKHVSRLPHTKGYVIINCSEQQNNLNLYIENSYSDKYKKTTNQGGIGILNVEERLKIQYPNAYYFKTEKKEDKFIVQLQITLNNTYVNG